MVVALRAVAALCWVVTGTAHGARLLVSHYSSSVFVLTLTPANGGSAANLTVSSTMPDGPLPGWLTPDSTSGTFYLSDESELKVPPPLLAQLAFGENSSVGVLASAIGSAGQVHSTLYGGVDGRGFIAVAQYNPSSITNYALPLNESARPPQTLRFTMNGTGAVPDRQDKPHPHSVNLDPTGAFIVAPDLGADLHRVLLVDKKTGNLSECPTVAASPGDGPRHAVFHVSATGATKLYVVNELSNTVTAWDVTARSGGCPNLNKTQTVSVYPPGKKRAPAGARAAEIHLAGNSVYITNRNDKTFGSLQDSCTTFDIDPATGNLNFIELTNTFTYFPRTFAINKAEDMVAFGGQLSSNVAIVSRNTATGRLGDLIAKLQVGPLGTDQGKGLSSVVWIE